jgi:hypothetical protein
MPDETTAEAPVSACLSRIAAREAAVDDLAPAPMHSGWRVHQ